MTRRLPVRTLARRVLPGNLPAAQSRPRIARGTACRPTGTNTPQLNVTVIVALVGQQVAVHHDGGGPRVRGHRGRCAAMAATARALVASGRTWSVQIGRE